MTLELETKFPQPFYFLSFVITQEDGSPCEFQTLFSNHAGSLKFFLEREQNGFRRAGWGLPNNVQYKIQLTNIEYDNPSVRIKVHESGQILIQGAVSENFLCWASSRVQSTLKGDRIQINTTALVEFTYNAISFLKRAVQDCENPGGIIIKFGFIGMDKNFVLGDAKLPSMGDPFNHSWSMNPVGDETEATLSLGTKELMEEDGTAKTAYAVLSRVYRMFGFTMDVISYADHSKKKIDIELFKQIV